MQVIIHRGAHEIGGTCIELATNRSRILLDLGLPLASGGLHIDLAAASPDAVLVSHPYIDHFGLIDLLDTQTPVYVGKVARRLMDAPRLLLNKPAYGNEFRNIEHKQSFTVGDFIVTPYLMDHSAVDAYAFLVEAEGKRVFYSGDFRAHGRKRVLFERLLADPPQDINLLFMEGTMLERSNGEFPTETAVENKIHETISHAEGASFLISSSQNIDRIVSAYRACLKARKTLVIDIYTAWILEQLKLVTNNVPSMEWEYIRIYATRSHDERLKANAEYFGDFRNRLYRQRIQPDEVYLTPSNYLFYGKMSWFKTINSYKRTGQVNVIYSQWLGYLEQQNQYGAHQVSAYRDDPAINFVYAHTSGHAPLRDLKKLVAALKPKMLVPVHTEKPALFSRHFQFVVKISDGQPFEL